MALMSGDFSFGFAWQKLGCRSREAHNGWSAGDWVLFGGGVVFALASKILVYLSPKRHVWTIIARPATGTSATGLRSLPQSKAQMRPGHSHVQPLHSDWPRLRLQHYTTLHNQQSRDPPDKAC